VGIIYTEQYAVWRVS